MTSNTNTRTASFSIRIPTDEQSRRYLSELGIRGLLTPYHGLEENRVMNIPQPIALPKLLAEELYSSTEVIMPFLKSKFPTSQDFQHYFESLEIKLLDQSIVPVNLGEKVHRRVHQLNLRPPMVADVILTVSERNVIATVVEFQSTSGICGEVHQSMEAAEAATGFPYTQHWYMGSVSPWEGLRQFRHLLVGEKPIYVIDAHSLTDGSIVDRTEMAQVLSDSLPLSFEEIERDDYGIYFREKRLEGNEAIFTGRKIYCHKEAFFSRITPDELMALAQELEEQEKNDTILIIIEFLSSPDVCWIHHPCESCLIDKRQLVNLANFTRERGISFGRYFSHKMYQAGEALPLGDYALKRVDGNGGVGTEIVKVIPANEVQLLVEREEIVLGKDLGSGKYQVSYPPQSTFSAEQRVSCMQIVSSDKPFIVPNGFMAQEKFTFLDVDVEIPSSLSPSKKITGILELRTISLPSPELDYPPAVFGFRLAPKTDPDRTRIVMTNIGESMQAHKKYMDMAGLVGAIREENIRRSPFGMGAAFTI